MTTSYAVHTTAEAHELRVGRTLLSAVRSGLQSGRAVAAANLDCPQTLMRSECLTHSRYRPAPENVM